MFLLGGLFLLVLFKRLHGVPLEILCSERFLQLFLPHPILFSADQQFTGVLTDPYYCCIVHGIGVLYGDYVVQLVDLLLDLPSCSLLGP